MTASSSGVPLSEREALICALAQIRWNAFGECRIPGWPGAPPTAAEAVAMIETALASRSTEPRCPATFLRAAAGLHPWQAWEICGPDDPNGEPVYFRAPPISADRDAYEGAREDLLDWKRRALAAEDLVRKFTREVNGPTFMGEPSNASVSTSDTPYNLGWASGWDACMRAHPASAARDPLGDSNESADHVLLAQEMFATIDGASKEAAVAADEAYAVWLKANRLPGNIRARQLFDSARVTSPARTTEPPAACVPGDSKGKYRLTWQEAEALCVRDEVDEAIREFAQDFTGDNAIGMVRCIVESWLRHPAPAAQVASDPSSVVKARELESIGRAVERAAEELPVGARIQIDLERDAGTVCYLRVGSGLWRTIEGGGEPFSAQIDAAIDAALAAQASGPDQAGGTQP